MAKRERSVSQDNAECSGCDNDSANKGQRHRSSQFPMNSPFHCCVVKGTGGAPLATLLESPYSSHMIASVPVPRNAGFPRKPFIPKGACLPAHLT